MRRFEELEVVGDGAFGVVTKCRDKETGELVAIKKMKKRYASFDECLQLKEVKSLRKIKHQNVVKLLQVFRENEYLYLVFELMGKSLLKTINERGGYPETDVRAIMFQVLTGLNYVHRQGFFHRDMKPDNLLWKDDDMSVLKIADFGLAREIRSRPPYTEYVATRWYRAPEIILRTENYNSPVDIWACGVIMSELFIARPLFQGTSETDQLYKIFAIIGPPTQKSWPDGIKYANKLGIRFPTTASCGLASAIPNASPTALSLISSMLKYDPSKRPSASQCLHHPFFTESDDSTNLDLFNTAQSDLSKTINTSHSQHPLKSNSDERLISNNLSNFVSTSAANFKNVPNHQNTKIDLKENSPPNVSTYSSMINLIAGKENNVLNANGKKIAGTGYNVLPNAYNLKKDDVDDILDNI